MVVQTHALARAASDVPQAPRVGALRSRTIVGAVVVTEAAWLLGLAVGAYALIF